MDGFSAEPLDLSMVCNGLVLLIRLSPLMARMAALASSITDHTIASVMLCSGAIFALFIFQTALCKPVGIFHILVCLI